MLSAPDFSFCSEIQDVTRTLEWTAAGQRNIRVCSVPITNMIGSQSVIQTKEMLAMNNTQSVAYTSFFVQAIMDFKWKDELEVEALCACAKALAGHTVTIVRPGGLTDGPFIGPEGRGAAWAAVAIPRRADAPDRWLDPVQLSIDPWAAAIIYTRHSSTTTNSTVSKLDLVVLGVSQRVQTVESVGHNVPHADNLVKNTVANGREVHPGIIVMKRKSG